MSGLRLRSIRLLTIIGLVALCGANAGARQSKAVDYKIGPDDVLSVTLFGQDPKYSGDVTVRPDGKITLPLLDDVRAAELTPLELKAVLTREYLKYFEEAVVYVSAKEIRSRKVYITGEVLKPGLYTMNDSMNIVQLIAVAGGLQPWADKENIVLIRKDPLPDGTTDKSLFDYKNVLRKGSKDTMLWLIPGDTVIVK
jgi:polysaccharide biosynthesis/export protein